MRIRVLRDVKKTAYNQKISLKGMQSFATHNAPEEIKKNVGTKTPTEFIHRRDNFKPELISKIQSVQEPVGTKAQNSFFERHKGVLPLVVIGVIIIFVINIFTVIVKTGFLKEDISYSAYEGYQSLIEGGENIFQTNFTEALNAFERAEAQFAAIEADLWFLKNDTSAQPFSDSKLADGGRVLGIGENLSLSGKEFSYGLVNLRTAANLFVQEFTQKNNEVPDFEKVEKKASITDELAIAEGHFAQAEAAVKSASFLLKQVDTGIYPAEYVPKVQQAIAKLDMLNGYLKDLNETFPAVLKLLGHEHQHTYLVLFHNSYELRPVLGFIGSYGLLDVNEGYVQKMEIKDVYDLDGQFHGEIPDIPEEIKEVAGTLKLRDSNYSPDAGVSLKNSAWFYQKEGGKSVDTVISVDQNILGKILYITGPITIDGLKAPITAENYDFMISYIVESKVYGADKPKQILNELFVKISEKLKNQQYQAKTFELLLSLIREKEVLAYSKDEQIEKLIEKFNLNGGLQQWKENSDGLQIVRTSIGGNKSDKYIKSNYTQTTYISETGRVSDKVEIELQHTWHQGVMNDWNRVLNEFGFTDFSDTVKDILGRGVNRSGIRVYVPKGAELMDVQGLPVNSINKKLDKDLDREYFYFEAEVAPQASRVISLEYKLPFQLDTGSADTYRFYYDPQIGAKNVKLNKIIRTDVGLKNYKNYPEAELTPNHTLEYSLSGTAAHYISGIWGR